MLTGSRTKVLTNRKGALHKEKVLLPGPRVGHNALYQGDYSIGFLQEIKALGFGRGHEIVQEMHLLGRRSTLDTIHTRDEEATQGQPTVGRQLEWSKVKIIENREEKMGVMGLYHPLSRYAQS